MTGCLLLCSGDLQLSSEVDDLKRQVEALQAANAALTSSAEKDKQLAVSDAATAASAKAEQTQRALQAEQEERNRLQEQLSEALASMEEERKSRGEDRTELERCERVGVRRPG